MDIITVRLASLWDTSQYSYSAIVDDDITIGEILETIYNRQQGDHKDVPGMPSLSAGDIVSFDDFCFRRRFSDWESIDDDAFFRWFHLSPSERKFSDKI